MTGIRRRNKNKTFVEKQIGILIDFSCVLYHSPADQKLMLTFSPDAYLGIIKHLSKLNEASGLKENIVATLMFYVYAWDTDEHRLNVYCDESEVPQITLHAVSRFGNLSFNFPRKSFYLAHIF